LIVDDDPDMRRVAGLFLAAEGIDFQEAEDGQEAWEMLEAGIAVDAVLLDRQMPRLDGLGLLKRIKAHGELAHIPVILNSSSGDASDRLEGLRGGAYYYLTKPVVHDMLLAVVRTALQDNQRVHDLRNALKESVRTLTLLDRGLFKIRTVLEAQSLTSLLANACPDPDKVAVGLSELMINAVVHGNLELTYEETTSCLEANRLVDEIRSRLDSPKHRERRVDVRFDRMPGRIRFTIQDQGPGFDWRKYIDFSPDRIFDNHGRGIAMARSQSFTRMEYLGRGNVVVAELDFDEDS
jgi:CheY-like chemotaxis protein